MAYTSIPAAAPSGVSQPSLDTQLTDYLKLAGRAGNQVAAGGTGAAGTLELKGTTHATPGKVIVNDIIAGGANGFRAQSSAGSAAVTLTGAGGAAIAFGANSMTMLGTGASFNCDLVLGTGTGSKIGTATSQKLSFFNSTPIVQPATAGEATGFGLGVGTPVTHNSTFTGNTGAAAYTIADVVKALKLLGLMAA